MGIRVERAYSSSSAGTAHAAKARRAHRYLVDRVWPRGVTKEALHLDAWLRDVAPSDALRRWFGHDAARWPEFETRYFAELDAHPDAWAPIAAAARAGEVTLVYGAKDEAHNNAVALRDYLQTRR